MSTVRSLSPWQPSLFYIRDRWKSLLPIGFIGLFLPLLAIDLSEVFSAQSAIESLRHQIAQTSAAGKPLDIQLFIGNISSFLKQTLLLWLVLLTALGTAYLGIIHATLKGLQKKSIPLPMALWLGFKTLIKKGILSFVFASIFCIALLFLMFSAPTGLGILGFFAQIMFLAAMGLCLLIPALLIISPNLSAFKVVSTCLTLKFVPPVKGLKWSIFFQVMSWQLLIVLALTLINTLRGFLFDLDIYLGVSRQWLYGSLEAVSYPTPIYVLTSLVSSLCISMLLVLMAVLSAFYTVNLQNLILSYHVGNYIHKKV